MDLPRREILGSGPRLGPRLLLPSATTLGRPRLGGGGGGGRPGLLCLRRFARRLPLARLLIVPRSLYSSSHTRNRVERAERLPANPGMGVERGL